MNQKESRIDIDDDCDNKTLNEQPNEEEPITEEDLKCLSTNREYHTIGLYLVAVLLLQTSTMRTLPINARFILALLAAVMFFTSFGYYICAGFKSVCRSKLSKAEREDRVKREGVLVMVMACWQIAIFQYMSAGIGGLESHIPTYVTYVIMGSFSFLGLWKV